MVLVSDILDVLDNITNGRCLKNSGDFSSNKNNYVVTKSSNIPGKAVTELPGLISGNLDMEVEKLAVTMTLSEHDIELAGATGVDVIVAHHPVADVCNFGGLLLKDYLNLYNIALFEVHEALHGLHPGMSWIHGHVPYYSNFSYDNIPGNVVYIGKILPEIKTLGDILNRLNNLMDLDSHTCLLNDNEKNSLCLRGEILLGNESSSVKNLIHIFPHTGFTSKHLEELVLKFPDIDTVLVSFSRVFSPHPIIEKSKELGLNFICGNSHTFEIFENGIPLAQAIKDYLPELEIVIFKENVTSIPLENISTVKMRNYAKYISKKYLHK